MAAFSQRQAYSTVFLFDFVGYSRPAPRRLEAVLGAKVHARNLPTICCGHGLDVPHVYFARPPELSRFLCCARTPRVMSATKGTFGAGGKSCAQDVF